MASCSSSRLARAVLGRCDVTGLNRGAGRMGREGDEKLILLHSTKGMSRTTA